MTALAATIERFRLAVAGPPDEVPLARAALLIAQAEYPGLDIEAFDRRPEEIAATLRQRLSSAPGAAASVEAVNALLFAEFGFRRDPEGDRDLRSLWLNDVLDRRLGTPLTLCLVYVDVCQRAGLDVRPVGLPGRVIARLAIPAEEPLLIDVGEGGRLLTVEQCRDLVRRTYGRRTEFRDYFLSAITPRQLLQRLLHNVKARALQDGDEERAARAMELLLAMFPWDLDELRDRGMLRERLGDYGGALQDLEQYVRYRASARDAQTVSEAVRSLRRHAGADAPPRPER